MSQISEYIEHKQLIGRVRGCGAKVKLIEDAAENPAVVCRCFDE